MKRWLMWIAAAALLLVLAACGGESDGNGAGVGETDGAEGASQAGQNAGQDGAVEQNEQPEEQKPEEQKPEEQAATEREVAYLDAAYTVPAHIGRIVITGAVEAMEDALVLGVEPVGAITYGGQFAERFAPITANAVSIGEKTQPDYEAILKLQPDVILGTSKFPEEVMEQLNKIATTIQVSHIATNWEANLRLLGELTGKQDEAERQISAYYSDLQTVKSSLAGSMKDKTVLAVRIRGGQINIYPATVFVNPILYNDLGLAVPEAVQAAKAQEAISIEQLAAINPDYLFVQFSADENKETQTALDEFKANPIVQKINAVKNGKLLINMIDPLSEGGPAWSRFSFLQAAAEQLE